MIIDPMEVLKTSRAILPTATPTNVVPIPSIVPPSPSYEHAHQSGKTTLWVVFVLMVITSAAFAAMSWRIPVSRRVYHVITTTMVIISSLAYFGMATGHGASYKHITVRHSHDHVPDTYDHVYRQVFWARYIDWALTTPLILLNLGLLAGLNGGYILMAILANVVMDLTGMFAAFSTVGTQRWGWFIIAIISYLVVIWHLVLNGRAHARAKGDKVNTFFTSITAFTVIVWTAYPIIWAIGSGSRKMSVDAEIITFAVLDVLSKAVFGAWLLITTAKLPESNIELGGFWTYGLSREGALRLGDENEA